MPTTKDIYSGYNKILYHFVYGGITPVSYTHLTLPTIYSV